MDINQVRVAGKEFKQFKNAQYDPNEYITRIPLEDQSKEQIVNLKRLMSQYNIVTITENGKYSNGEKLYSISKGNESYFSVKVKFPNSTGEYCSGRKWTPKQSQEGLRLNWCDLKGSACGLSAVQKKVNKIEGRSLHAPYDKIEVVPEFSSSSSSSVHEEYYQLNSLSTFIDLFNANSTADNTIEHDEYTQFLGWLNELNRIAYKLNCKGCGTLMYPNSSNYAAKRITKFKCTNS